MSDYMRNARILLITGVPGVGKTTAIRAVAQAIATRPLAGFYTEEIRESGARKGFRLIGFDGQQGVIAHVDLPHNYRVGKYGVDLEAIDRLTAATLSASDPNSVFLIDEIGKMECLSSRFVAAMSDLLNTGKPVVATIARTGGGFIAEVKARPDALLWEITRATRDTMPERIMGWLAAVAKVDCSY